MCAYVCMGRPCFGATCTVYTYQRVAEWPGHADPAIRRHSARAAELKLNKELTDARNDAALGNSSFSPMMLIKWGKHGMSKQSAAAGAISFCTYV